MAYELQRSFAAGELTPKAWLRDDLKLHDSAVKKMRNVIADPHGIAESRLGFDFIEELVGESYCRLFDFDFSSSESVVIAVTPNTIHIVDKNGFTLGDNVIINGHFSFGPISWIEERVLFSSGLALFQPGAGGQEAHLRQQMIGLTIGEIHRITITGFSFDGVSDFIINLGTTQGNNDIQVIPGTGEIFVFEFTPAITDIWFEMVVAGGGDSKTVDSIAVREVSASGPVSFPSTYTDNDIFEMQVDKEPGNKNMYFMTRGHQPMVLNHDGEDYSFSPVVFQFGDDGAEPPIANPAPWGTEYPGCITFHDGRMVLGGTYSLPVHVWLSKPQRYVDFTLADPSASKDDDSMVLPLDKHGELQWLRSNKKLFAGLDTGEHVIFGVNGPLSPGNAQTEQHSSYGSSRAHAILVDEQTIYIDKQRRTVRAMDYLDTTNGYVSEDISFQAEHITVGRLTELKFGISPAGAIWFPTFSGELVACSIERDQGTIGWHRHTTQGEIISITTLKEFGVDVPWIAVIRNGRLFVERYSIDDFAYMDSAHRVVEDNPTDTFFGFDHLIGLTVQVIADGSVHPDRVVQPDGSIILQVDAVNVVAGLGFLAEMETLPQQKKLDSGETLFHAKRWSDIAVYVINSPRPLINGEETYRRDPLTPMNTREGSETGVVEISSDGWDVDATITVSQPLPLPMVIAGIGGKLKENKM